MIVVADTGPIISLAVIDKLSILNSLFGNISIPEAVWKN
jgi:predicted nucleic acid-binding protein